MSRQIRSGKGFTLLETLIALLVLSFGLLGLAGLQLKSLQSSHSSYQRGLANIIAADAVERLWANMAAAAPLTAAQVQAQWLQHWTNTANNRLTLPGLGGVITPPAAGGTQYSVTVTWTENRFGNNGNSSFVYNFMLYP